jgi:hypothetical protein
MSHWARLSVKVSGLMGFAEASMASLRMKVLIAGSPSVN